jgi:hypothetical protein
MKNCDITDKQMQKIYKKIGENVKNERKKKEKRKI